MKSVKDFVILALAISVVTAAYLVWNEHARALGIHSQAVRPNETEELQKRLVESNARIQDLTRQLASRSEPPAFGPHRRNFGGPPGPGGPGDIRAIMDQPEMQRLRALEQRSALDNRYAALFRDLKLPAATLDKLKDLLVEKDVTMQDMLAVARDHGVDPRIDPVGFHELVASAQNETESAIKGLLGDDAFTQFQQYQQTLPQRGLVNQLQQSLSYTSEPLTESQATGLLQLLATGNASAQVATDGPPPMGFGPPAGGPAGGPPGAGPRTIITQDMVNVSQNVLTAGQVQVLQQLQQSQQAQAQIFRTLLENGGMGRLGPQAAIAH